MEKKKTKIEIKHRWFGTVLFTHESEKDNYPEQLGEAVKEAVKARAVLTGAVLTGADLTGADLTDAVLTGAVLTGAVLTGAVLTDAVLTGADLTDAVLTGAVLTGADLTDAVLTGADLTDADLTGAVLTRAWLEPIKKDLIAEIVRLPDELPALRLAIIEGRIDGSQYAGECACLAGTIANVRGLEDYCGEDIAINERVIFRASSSSPRERWFSGIKEGDTPETNQIAKIALGWVEEAIAIVEHIRATGRRDGQ